MEMILTTVKMMTVTMHRDDLNEDSGDMSVTETTADMTLEMLTPWEVSESVKQGMIMKAQLDEL